jgi:ribonuclease R
LRFAKESRERAKKIIEDFMIKANEVVAEHLYRRKIPVLYRVHEKPRKNP